MMNDQDMSDALCWYVVHTHLKQEDRAEKNLRALNVETLTPKIRERRYNQFTGAPIYLTSPLFPRYIFARFKIKDSYHKIRFTRGVHYLVSFNDRPAPVAGEVIASLQSRMGDDGFVRTGDIFHAGDKVIINDGPLCNFTGVFDREMKGTDRVRILLQTISYQPHAEVDREMVRKIALQAG